ncbi:MAG: YicC/YloC family endoribonuclease [bacterium]
MVQSMTTFARFSDQGAWGMATWEIRAVNHRYFDCSIKMPEVLRSLETNIRLCLQQQLHRGRVECALKFQPGEQSGLNLMLNISLVKKLADAIGEVKNYVATKPAVDPMKILAWPQVLQVVEEDIEAVHKIILQLFEKTLIDLIATRKREGAALVKIMQSKLREVLAITGKVKTKIPLVLANQRAKIMQRLDEIKSELDQTRLEQEMAYIVQRMDVAEELDRLETHSKEIGRILMTGGNIGKRLDFLMQELNREANTLASKSVDIEVTQAAVELKVLIEQMREQVQNIV